MAACCVLLPSSISFLIVLLLPSTAAPATSLEYSFVQSESPAPRTSPEKLTHLRFFWHDVMTGSDPTAILVAQAPTSRTSPTFFGRSVVTDNALTVAPERSSRLVGWSQGIYVSASKHELRYLMAGTFVFTEGRYNGSYVTMVGLNRVVMAGREMPIVGGSGVFRWATGYAEAKTYWLNTTSGDAIVEYNVFVKHY